MATYEEDLLAMAQSILAGSGGVAGLTFNEAMKAMAAYIVLNGAGGGSSTPTTPRISGTWYPPSIPVDGFDGGGALTAGTAEFAPFFVDGETQQFDRIACNVATIGSAGVLRMGIYKAHATTRLPDALVLDAGTVDPAVAGDKLLTILQSLPPAMYWPMMVTNSTGCSVRKTAGSSIQHRDWIKGGDGLDMSAAGVGLRTTGWNAANPLPATAILTSPTWRRIDVPCVFLRKA